MRHLLEAALARRAPLRQPGTNALRLIDGDGDDLPGLELEDFAGKWLLSTRDRHPPAPLVEWLRSKGHATYWKQLDQQQKESPAHLCGPEQDEPFPIQESGLNFEISFQSGYSQGIFLDQRDRRAELRSRLSAGQTLLNTFAYTGAFSVFAAAAGATTTTLDLAQPYLDWAKRNFELNGFDPSAHYYCKGDTFHWLARFAKQGRTFDGIVLDPPTFSRDKDGKVFRVEKDYGRLAELAMKCLTPGGFLLASTNCRTLSPRDFEAQLRGASRRPVKIRHNDMPADFTGEQYLKSVWVDT
ncbi:class I SAM-dependent methyltransferase [Luteolibacter flavescens]|uniref:Class I SAM-dependent methyltransferase n=1 Tax=Luteolibacter flavescens TaxID=1859460 RepID=A0ABT3FQQ0_9BACT|nr:class I SAM-dependent methyltransferase [Luteolibacter flavescens]MCW1885903.1 class I SAM-dependent methyltransferase [Luteolibacter flavescens]